jgi:hypothetical protein
MDVVLDRGYSRGICKDYLKLYLEALDMQESKVTNQYSNNGNHKTNHTITATTFLIKFILL